MAESAIDTLTIKLQSELSISAYLAQPSIPGIYPGIVVLQEIFGVNAHIREVAERLASSGYVAIAPALFERQAPNFETLYTQEAIKLGKTYAWERSKANELKSDIQAAIDYLKTLPNIKQDGFGCIGFCFGGHVAYLAATLLDIKATASFYGTQITNATPGGGNPTITHTPEIPGTIYAFFGMEDASIPVEQVNQIEVELEKCNIPHRVFRYDGAEHGFFCDHRASYNSLAANDAWEKVKQLFAQQLS